MTELRPGQIAAYTPTASTYNRGFSPVYTSSPGPVYPPSGTQWGNVASSIGGLASGNGNWAAAREKLMKRRSVRHVALSEGGTLVYDIPVPAQIIPTGAKQEEMTKMRYTAVTCDPDEFMRNKYTLRPFLLGRRTELYIVMTM